MALFWLNVGLWVSYGQLGQPPVQVEQLVNKTKQFRSCTKVIEGGERVWCGGGWRLTALKYFLSQKRDLLSDMSQKRDKVS